MEKEELDQDKIAKTTTVTAFTGSRTTTADTKTTDTSTTTKKSTESEKVVDVPDNLDDSQWEGDVMKYPARAKTSVQWVHTMARSRTATSMRTP